MTRKQTTNTKALPLENFFEGPHALEGGALVAGLPPALLVPPYHYLTMQLRFLDEHGVALPVSTCEVRLTYNGRYQAMGLVHTDATPDNPAGKMRDALGATFAAALCRVCQAPDFE